MARVIGHDKYTVIRHQRQIHYINNIQAIEILNIEGQEFKYLEEMDGS